MCTSPNNTSAFHILLVENENRMMVTQGLKTDTVRQQGLLTRGGISQAPMDFLNADMTLLSA